MLVLPTVEGAVLGDTFCRDFTPTMSLGFFEFQAQKTELQKLPELCLGLEGVSILVSIAC